MNLISWTLSYKLYDFVKNTYEYIKDVYYLGDTLYSTELKAVLKKYLGINFKKDWIGRLYGVINPNINVNGELDFSNTIIEIDGEFTNSTEYVKHWTFKQLDLIGNVFKINKLYDYLSIEFKHVGPVNQDNYLIILDLTSRKYFTYSLKKMLKQVLFYTIIGIIIITSYMMFV